MHDAQLSDNALPNLLLGLYVDDLVQQMNGSVTGWIKPQAESETHLSRHYGLCGSVLNLADGTSIASPKLLYDDEVFCMQVEPELDTDLQGILAIIIVGLSS